jgi:hypothetical protein
MAESSSPIPTRQAQGFPQQEADRLLCVMPRRPTPPAARSDKPQRGGYRDGSFGGTRRLVASSSLRLPVWWRRGAGRCRVRRPRTYQVGTGVSRSATRAHRQTGRVHGPGQNQCVPSQIGSGYCGPFTVRYATGSAGIGSSGSTPARRQYQCPPFSGTTITSQVRSHRRA